MPEQPGTITLFGSGETSSSGRKVFDWIMRRLPAPVHVAILETPAGFEPNSSQVAGRIGEFLVQRLQNHQPQVTLVPACRRGTACSPDEPGVVSPLRNADLIFLGPGSPTYAVRQLRDSLAWYALIAQQRLGASVVLSSSAAVAAGRFALPVYEIYKVGEDLHWKAGLDLFACYGFSLAIIPHWNNAEGGADLDTSRCWMGQERFEQLYSMLPPDTVVVGLDEHTSLVFDVEQDTCRVMGKGGITLLRCGEVLRFEQGRTFSARELGPFHQPEPQDGIPLHVWEWVKASVEIRDSKPQPPAEVLALLQRRQSARHNRDWAAADQLREQINRLGWQVEDTPQGAHLIPSSDQGHRL